MKKLLLLPFSFLLVNICKGQMPVAAFSVDEDTICAGTCINFTNLSANATSYQWIFPGGTPSTSTTANPLVCYSTPLTYSVTLIATNSFGSDTLTIYNCITLYPYPPPLNLITHGDTMFATQGFLHYQWYLNSTLLPNDTLYYHVAMHDGTHYVTTIDSNGCENGLGTFGPLYLPDFTPSDTAFCAGTCINITNHTQWLSGDSAWATHQWYFNGATPSLSQDYHPQNICYNNAGTYLIKYIVLVGITCRTDSFTVNVLTCTDVFENSYRQFHLSPNPFTTTLTLHFPTHHKEKAHLSIFNSIGEAVVEKEIQMEDQTLNLAALPKGIYLVRVKSGKGVYTQKMVKE